VDEIPKVEAEQAESSVQDKVSALFRGVAAVLECSSFMLVESIQQQASRAKAESKKSVETVGTDSCGKPQKERGYVCRSLNTKRDGTH
jgi:hypothetical protein